MMKKQRIGILAGGGPAPGINSVISAATIEAINSGREVVGIIDGFEHLMAGRTDLARPLMIADVSRIHSQGGSVLGISRANPTSDREKLQNVVASMRKLEIDAFVSIGGEDTLYASSQVAKASDGAIRMVHVPKTIDNDLPLPGGMPTFGFETARHVGTNQVLNLAEEARTTKRWFLVVVMGRKAGHLALGIGMSAGATLTIIPEEFPEEQIRLEAISSIIAGSILKRLSRGQHHGVAVIAEGLVEKLGAEELQGIPGAEITFDPHGHMRLEEVPIGAVLRRRVSSQLAAWKQSVRVTDVGLGYTLRSAPPIPFDIDYTRTLGHGAIRFLVSEPSNGDFKDGGMVCLEAGHLRYMSIPELRDVKTGKIRTRVVDTSAYHYKVARDYMIRLEPEDLEDPATLQSLATAAGVSGGELKRQFAPLVGAPVAS